MGRRYIRGISEIYPRYIRGALGELPGWSEKGRREDVSLCENSFSVREHDATDHRAVRCTVAVTEAREKQRRRRRVMMGPPLRAGVRGRTGTRGVARRPLKGESCAKVEPHTEHSASPLHPASPLHTNYI